MIFKTTIGFKFCCSEYIIQETIPVIGFVHQPRGNQV